MKAIDRATLDGNWYLCGFMGAGKSTVGERLATKVSRPFIDLDELIEEKAGQTVATIFHIEGEASFRKLERDTLARVAGQNGAVVALGGGAVMDNDNRERIAESGLMVYLAWPFERLVERIHLDDARPLARNREQLRALYLERQPVYRAANFTLQCHGYQSEDDIAQAILELIKGSK